MLFGNSFLLSFILLLPHSSSLYTVDVDTLWTRNFGGTGYDRAFSLQQTSGDGYIMAGITSSFTPNPAYYLVKADSYGYFEWDNYFIARYMVGASSAVQTADGGYLLAGSEGDMPLAYINAVKTDQSGNQEWQTHYFSNYPYTTCRTILPTSDGNYVLGGSAYAQPCSEMYLLKIDDQGTTQWEYYIGEGVVGEHLVGNSVQQTSDGFVIAGRGTGPSWDAIIVKISIGGSIQWQTTIGGPGFDSFHCVRQVLDGSYVAVGQYEQDSDHDIYMVMFDSSGEPVWEKTIGNGNNESAEAFLQTQDGGFIIVGTSYDSTYSESDVYLVKTDYSGEIEWESCLGGPEYDKGSDILEISENIYVITGSTYSDEINGTDVLLLKVDTSQEGIAQESDPSECGDLQIVSCFPNPCRGSAEIIYRLNETRYISISVFDIGGHLVRKLGTHQHLPGNHAVSWDGTDDYGHVLPNGIYTVLMSSGTENAVLKMVLLR